VGWKSVDMQVALPRTQDAGQLQEQMSKQQQRFQESLAHSQLKQDLVKRRQVLEYERTTGKSIQDEQDNGSSNESKQDQRKKEQQDEDHLIEHPYLGKKIDFSR